MLNPEYYETATNRLSKLFLEMENWAIQDIVRRIAKTGRITETAEYQLLRLAEIKGFNKDYRKRLARLLKQSIGEVDRIYKEATEKAYLYDKDLFTALDKPWIPIEQNAFIKQLVPAMIEQTAGEITNLTQTTALKMITPDGSYAPLPETFIKQLDMAEAKVSTGVQDYNSAIQQTVKELSKSGIRVVRYEGEGKKPVNRRIEGVVRVTVLTGMAQLANKVSLNNIEQLGAEHVLVSQHVGARTGEGFRGHINWQGRVFSIKKEKL